MKIISYATQSPELGTGYVYLWTNLINGKQYIGKHQGTDPNYIGSGILFKAAVKKYGIENFVRVILYVGPRFEDVEIEILKAISADKNRKYYNMVDHKGGVPSGYQFSDEARKRMSKASIGKPKSSTHAENISKGRKGIVFSDEHRYKISVSKKGQSHPQTPETRKLISASLTGRKRPEVGLKVSYNSHIKFHIDLGKMPKNPCRWCNGDTLEQALEMTKEDT
jgi:group I intron endonuclease